MEIDWEAMAGHDWFRYNFKDDRIMVLPEEPSLIRCSASGVIMREGGRPEIRPKYQEEFANCGISMEYARLVRCLYLAEGTDLKTVFTVE